MSATLKYQLHRVSSFASRSQGAPQPTSKHRRAAVTNHVGLAGGWRYPRDRLVIAIAVRLSSQSSAGVVGRCQPEDGRLLIFTYDVQNWPCMAVRALLSGLSGQGGTATVGEKLVHREP
jgi:hypothetical protein